VVHRRNCRNLRELLKHPDRCLVVTWAPITHGMFNAALRLLAKNAPGVLANISASIDDAGSNIEKVEQPEANPETARLLFTIGVEDRDHMARVIQRLRRNRNVLRVSRVNA
jgi:(p)ppGpp synthase/HD superfamily hydrolase